MLVAVAVGVAAVATVLSVMCCDNIFIYIVFLYIYIYLIYIYILYDI